MISDIQTDTKPSGIVRPFKSKLTNAAFIEADRSWHAGNVVGIVAVGI